MDTQQENFNLEYNGNTFLNYIFPNLIVNSRNYNMLFRYGVN